MFTLLQAGTASNATANGSNFCLNPQTFSNALTVAGATTLSNVAQSGAASFSNGSVGVGGALNVAGSAVHAGAAFLSNTLAVSGAATLSNAVAYGALVASNGLTVNSNLVVYSGSTNVPAARFVGLNGGQVIVGGADSAAAYNSLTKASDAYVLSMSNATADAGGLVLGPWSGTAKGIRIDGATGNVGVGSSTPAYLLDVAGSVSASNARAGDVAVGGTYRNRVLNPGAVLDANGDGVPDGFAYQNGYGAAVTLAYSLNTANVPAGSTSSAKVAVTATSIAPGAAPTQYAHLLVQQMPSASISDLGWGTAAAAPVTVQFSAYSSVATTFFLALRDSVAAVSLVLPFALAAGTWTPVAFSVPGCTFGTQWSSVTLLITTGSGTAVAAPSLAGTWINANTISLTSDTTTFLSAVGNYAQFTAFQLEKGQVATALEARPLALETALVAAGSVPAGGPLGAGSVAAAGSLAVAGSASVGPAAGSAADVAVIADNGWGAGAQTGTLAGLAAYGSAAANYVQLIGANSGAAAVTGGYYWAVNPSPNFTATFDFASGGGAVAGETLQFYFYATAAMSTNTSAVGGYIVTLNTYVNDPWYGPAGVYLHFDATGFAGYPSSAQLGAKPLAFFAAPALASASWQTLKVTVVGGTTVAVALNGAPVISFVDPNIRSVAGGYVGLLALNHTGLDYHRVRNVLVARTGASSASTQLAVAGAVACSTLAVTGPPGGGSGANANAAALAVSGGLSATYGGVAVGGTYKNKVINPAFAADAAYGGAEASFCCSPVSGDPAVLFDLTTDMLPTTTTTVSSWGYAGQGAGFVAPTAANTGGPAYSSTGCPYGNGSFVTTAWVPPYKYMLTGGSLSIPVATNKGFTFAMTYNVLSLETSNYDRLFQIRNGANQMLAICRNGATAALEVYFLNQSNVGVVTTDVGVNNTLFSATGGWITLIIVCDFNANQLRTYTTSGTTPAYTVTGLSSAGLTDLVCDTNGLILGADGAGAYSNLQIHQAMFAARPFSAAEVAAYYAYMTVNAPTQVFNPVNTLQSSGVLFDIDTSTLTSGPVGAWGPFTQSNATYKPTLTASGGPYGNRSYITPAAATIGTITPTMSTYSTVNLQFSAGGGITCALVYYVNALSGTWDGVVDIINSAGGQVLWIGGNNNLLYFTFINGIVFNITIPKCWTVGSWNTVLFTYNVSTNIATYIANGQSVTVAAAGTPSALAGANTTPNAFGISLGNQGSVTGNWNLQHAMLAAMPFTAAQMAAYYATMVGQQSPVLYRPVVAGPAANVIFDLNTDAGLTLASGGTAVAQWGPFAQATSANQPAYASSGGYNGAPTVTTNGSPQFLSCPTSVSVPWYTNGGFTFAATFKIVSCVANGYDTIAELRYNVSNEMFFVRRSGGSNDIQFYVNNWNGTTVANAANIAVPKCYTAGGWYTLLFVYTSGGSLQVWTTSASGTVASSTYSGGALTADAATYDMSLGQNGFSQNYANVAYRNVMLAATPFTAAQAAAYMAYQTSLVQPMLPAPAPTLGGFSCLPGTCGLKVQRVPVPAGAPAAMAGLGMAYALKATVTVGSPTLGVNVLAQQTLPPSSVADLAWGTWVAKPATASFWMYSSVAATFFLALRDTSASQAMAGAAPSVNSFVSTLAMQAGQWTRWTVAVPGPTTFVGSAGVDVLVTSSVRAGSCAASNASGTWTYGAAVKGGYLGVAGSSDASFVGATGSFAMLAGLQLEAGGAATALETRGALAEAAFVQAGAITHTTGQGNASLTGGLTAGGDASFGGAIVADPTWGKMTYPKNRLINGSFAIDTVNNGNLRTGIDWSYTMVDLWHGMMSVGGTFSSQRVALTSADLPYTAANLQTALQITCTTANAGGTGGNQTAFGQDVPSSSIADFNYGKSYASVTTLSFWIKANVSLPALSFGITGACGQYMQNVALTANTWTYVTQSIPAPTTVATTTSMSVVFGAYTLVAGTTAGAWVTPFYLGANNATNWAAVGNVLTVTGFQWEAGSAATPFQARSLAAEAAYAAAGSVALPADAPLQLLGDVAVARGNVTVGAAYRNRVVNGDMRIDTINNGAASTLTMQASSINGWMYWVSITTGSVQAQQVPLQATDGPYQAGLRYALRHTVATACTAYNYFVPNQPIPQASYADLGWGTSSGLPVTLSLWFCASQAGSYNVVVRHSVTSWTGFVTVAAPNAWAYYSFAIPAPATGTTWTTYQMQLEIGGIQNTSVAPTPGWNSTGYESLAGYTNWLATAGNTIAFTGVQLEAGLAPTAFDFRPLAVEKQALANMPAPSVTAGNGMIALDPTYGQGNLVCAGSVSAQNLGMGRNRVINGDMRVNQRGATSLTITGTTGPWPGVTLVDRWLLAANLTTGTLTPSVVTLSSTDTPYNAGFGSAYMLTATVACTPLYILPYQCIEGCNIADFNWGKYSGISVTLSFWLRCNVGCVSVTLQNYNQGYSYNVNVAGGTPGVWQYVTLTIPAPPVGSTWLTDTGKGILLLIGGWQPMNALGTNATWSAANAVGSASGTNPWAVAGNYVEFTGVQLEKGSIATPFEFRPLTLELQLCQRYYVAFVSSGTSRLLQGAIMSGPTAYFLVPLPVAMRAAPTLSTNIPVAQMFANGAGFGGAYTAAMLTAGASSAFSINGTDTTTTVGAFAIALAGTGNVCTLAVGAPVYLNPAAAGFYVAFVAEL